MDLTLVIQGRLTQESYDFYTDTYPNVKKIFSTWSDNKISLSAESNQEIIRNDIPKIGFKRQNLNLQVFSTMMGMRQVQTKYAIKLRGDEKYSNLLDVLPAIESCEEKIYTVPVFFRKWNNHPFHMSDHLMAGLTCNLRLMFEESWDTIRHPEILKRHFRFRNSAETIIGKSYLDAKTGADLSPNDESKVIFKKHFAVIPMELLSPYKVSFFRKSTNHFNPRKWNSISNINEL